jgi:phosphoribosylaminoimidazolecarboxamide formyltransferase/IMP cyclohydrolase
VVDPARYDEVLAAVAAGGFTLAERQRLAAAAFRHTATYDIAVASWMGNVLAPDDDSGFPAWVGASWDRADVCATARTPTSARPSTAGCSPGWRTPSSCTARPCRTTTTSTPTPPGEAAHDHADPCVAIIKHANPAGSRSAADVATAHRKAHACDPTSAFGGVIAANREVDVTTAEQVAGVFTEVVVAPSFTAEALAVLTAKKNIRLLRLPHLPRAGAELRRSAAPAAPGGRPDRRPGRRPTTWTPRHRRPARR